MKRNLDALTDEKTTLAELSKRTDLYKSTLLRLIKSLERFGYVLRDADVREATAAGAVLLAVPLLSDAGRTVRINVSLDKGLVDQIDAAASARGLTRSAFLAQAAREKITGESIR